MRDTAKKVNNAKQCKTMSNSVKHVVVKNISGWLAGLIS